MQVHRKSRTPELMKALNTLRRSKVYIGIPAGAAPRDDGDITMAALGYLFERGSPSTNMPARPWLRPGVALMKDRAVKLFAAGGRKLLQDGRASEYGKTLHAVGLLGQSTVQGYVQAGIAPPLAESTVYKRLHRRRNRRSAGPMTPLIDTGGFVKAITYAVDIQ